MTDSDISAYRVPVTMRTGLAVFAAIALLVLFSVSAGEADAGEPVTIHSTAPGSEAWVDAEIGAELPRVWAELWGDMGTWVLSDGTVWNPYDPWSNYMVQDGIIEITLRTDPEPAGSKDNSGIYWVAGFAIGAAALACIIGAIYARRQ